jgi:hypothetical protein
MTRSPRPIPSRALAAALAAAAIAYPDPPAAVADGDDAAAAAVKAAFIYNFAQFTGWPNSAFPAPDSPFVIGVVGPDPFDHALDRAMDGKAVRGHPVQVKYLTAPVAPADLAACHLVYVPASAEAQLADVIRATANHPVLVVGETDAVMRAGGAIRFFADGDRLRFEINPAVAPKVHLRFSSKLVKLARIFAG